MTRIWISPSKAPYGAGLELAVNAAPLPAGVAVHKKVYSEFLDRFARRTKRLKLGDGLDADTEVGPLVNETQLQTVMKYVEIGKNEGAKLITGGSRAESGCAGHTAGTTSRRFFPKPSRECALRRKKYLDRSSP